MRRRNRAVSLCAGLSLVLLAGCANTATRSAVIVSGSTLSVYASQPPGGSGGPQAADVLAAEQLALMDVGGRAGKYTVSFKRISGAELSDNARRAIQDPTTIAYLGELQPGTSQISVEILNQQGVLEVSPADTAIYLTQPTAVVPGAPTKYYPTRSTYHETFARVVPNSAREAKAQIQEMQSLHVTKLYVASDGQPYGAALALEVAQDAGAARLSVKQGPATAAGVQSFGADALFYGSSVQSPSAGQAAAALLDAVAAAQPSVKLFAPSGLYADSLAGAMSPAAQQKLYVSSPGFLTKDLSPAGQSFLSRFKAASGHDPAPQAIFGYEAMAALLAVIRSAGGSRANVVADFLSYKSSQSVLGTYSISGGDPSIGPFIFARPRGGQLTPFAFVQAPG